MSSNCFPAATSSWCGWAGPQRSLQTCAVAPTAASDRRRWTKPHPKPGPRPASRAGSSRSWRWGRRNCHSAAALVAPAAAGSGVASCGRLLVHHPCSVPSSSFKAATVRGRLGVERADVVGEARLAAADPVAEHDHGPEGHCRAPSDHKGPSPPPYSPRLDKTVACEPRSISRCRRCETCTSMVSGPMSQSPRRLRSWVLLIG